MSPFLTLLICVWFSTKTEKSPKGSPVYVAIFESSVTFSAKIDIVEKELKTKEDSILNEVTKNFFEQLGTEIYSLSTRDSVYCYLDSAVISRQIVDSGTMQSSKVTYNIAHKNYYYKSGRFFLFEPKEEELFEESEYEPYFFLAKGEILHDYPTDIYTNKDKSSKIWIATGLPNHINTGIPIRNPPGAILKYEKIKGKMRVNSELLEIKAY